MQKITAVALIFAQLTGCFSHVINVEQVHTTNVAVLNGKRVEMPKPGCYIDNGHGRFCTGSEYTVNSSAQWVFSRDIPGTVKEDDAPDYKIASNDVSTTTTDYAKTIGQVIGVVAVFALIITGIYYARKAGVYYQPAIVSNASDSVITSRVDGEFNGWKGETIVTLTNGQIWKQSEHHYYYHYAYMPEVTIYRDGARYKMIVKGIEKSVGVDRIN